MVFANRLINIIITVLFSILIASTTLQVVSRFIGFTSAWTMEIATYAFIWLVFLGGYFTIKKGINITFDLVIDALPRSLWRFLFTFTNIISCAFLIFIIFAGTKLAINFGSVSPVLQIPMKFIAFSIPIGGVTMLLAQISSYFSHMKKEQEA